VNWYRGYSHAPCFDCPYYTTRRAGVQTGLKHTQRGSMTV